MRVRYPIKIDIILYIIILYSKFLFSSFVALLVVSEQSMRKLDFTIKVIKEKLIVAVTGLALLYDASLSAFGDIKWRNEVWRKVVEVDSRAAFVFKRYLVKSDAEINP